MEHLSSEQVIDANGTDPVIDDLMGIEEAMSIVLSLAEGNIFTDEEAQGGMEDEQARQQIAVEMVQEYHENVSELLDAAGTVLTDFAEGVVWNDDQRKSYTDLHETTSRFRPTLARFQSETTH